MSETTETELGSETESSIQVSERGSVEVQAEVHVVDNDGTQVTSKSAAGAENGDVKSDLKPMEIKGDVNVWYDGYK